MQLLIALIVTLAYLEWREYRNARRLRRVQLAVSRLTSQMNKAVKESVQEAISKIQTDVSDVLVKQEHIIKEYEVVTQYRRNAVNLGHADFIEG